MLKMPVPKAGALLSRDRNTGFSAPAAILSIALAALLALCLVAALVGACSPLPSLENRHISTAVLDTGTTRLGSAIAPLVEAHPGKSGIYALPDAYEAFAARMLLVEAADISLDIQYYIWRHDRTGTLLFDTLHQAAERGVRVRILLDDNNTSGLDATLAALDSHPNMEIRLFNPFVIRSARWIGYLTDFSRLNRRMHNKSFTADSQTTIIGGRNIGDEYFAAKDGVLFADLDVLAVGPIAKEVSVDFDRYWASGSSYPVNRLLPAAEPGGLAELAAAATRVERDPAAAAYLDVVRHSAFVHELLQRDLTLEWAPTRMISDDPAKGLGLAEPEALLFQKLTKVMGDPKTELDLVSPYFVPTMEGVDAFATLARQGVRVRILVNSLEATDVDVVHSGYAKWRKPLLEAGITLYESKLEVPRTEGSRRAGPFGSSASSLHAKTFSVDRSRVFIGSFNFDPRSANLNTELGFVIDSAALAEQMASVFDSRVPANAYEVHLSETNKLYWIEQRNGEHVRHDTEPHTSVWQRAFVWVMSLLPIDGLL